MSTELVILTITAASIGFFHTLVGPDHYVPFIVMARARKWSAVKTMLITFLCGIGHIGSSVLLGLIGVALGISVTKLGAVESFRGNIAAWAMIAFGLLYFVWGLRRAFRSRPHKHLHDHEDEDEHEHLHVHAKEHVHVHAPLQNSQNFVTGHEEGANGSTPLTIGTERSRSANITPWVLFTIFIFGPCEPLIPILIYPAAKNSLFGVALVTAVFGAATILTMMGIVLVSSLGVSLLPMGKLERYSHALAGATVCICGLAIQFLGL